MGISLVGCPSPATAAGWHDYELQIAPGYTVHRANSMDIALCDNNGYAPVPTDTTTGPLVGYVVTPNHIFTHHHGRKLRNAFQGDTFEEVDPTRGIYFIVDRGTNQVIGPLSLQSFRKRPAVQTATLNNASAINWQVPRNPNILLPMLGSAMFLVFVLTPLAAVLAVLTGIAFVVIYLWRGVKAR